MRLIFVATLGLAMSGAAAFADDKPSSDEAGKLKEVVTTWGCEGGTLKRRPKPPASSRRMT